ncbi:hypothetical protein SDRG_16428 [Saprolegnia diclina VS20]|uniref:Uncharacterized protein n=1 Tax=Saprolegnia diclina (strain VS20) TaxID=1156394 RepID=T0PJX8_SAPDV|nr:hypothetical protein SDRG_16428 [Saprolegnia diclina VS20]EQC25689.1 hypothetical protein SDRG_16428 [Saprolegnia diclina VS20]|eukprot:XP_008620859.1 hypothetical protein SDRG_16428 [Saprolegnia diclina VS20]
MSLSSTSTMALTASTSVTITGTSTVVAGGHLHVSANDFLVTSNGANQVFVVTAASGAVSIAGDITLSSNVAQIMHSGSTSLTITSPSVIFTGGSVVLDGSASTPVSSTPCAKGTIQFDASYVYICSSTDTWRKAALAPI